MRVHQAGGYLMQERGAAVDDWSLQKNRRRFGLLWGLTQPYRRRTAFSVLSLLAATATALAPPYLAKLALDDAVQGHGGAQLVIVVVIFVAAGLANWAMYYVETYMTGWVGERILADLRLRLFGHLQHLAAAPVRESDAFERDVACDRRQLECVRPVDDLRLLVEHARDLVERRRRGEERVVELRELLNRVEEVLHVQHEGEERSEGERAAEVEMAAVAQHDGECDGREQVDDREIDPVQHDGLHVRLAVAECH